VSAVFSATEVSAV